jgi:hypothetical protein
MQTECSADLFGFAGVEGRSVVAAFDGGKITSDAGGVLLRATDRAVGLIDRFAQCFSDSRSEELIEHTVATMIGQRVFGIALGYEDVVDHDTLRPRPDHGGVGRQADGKTQELRGGRRQIDPQPARTG